MPIGEAHHALPIGDEIHRAGRRHHAKAMAGEMLRCHERSIGRMGGIHPARGGCVRMEAGNPCDADDFRGVAPDDGRAVAQQAQHRLVTKLAPADPHGVQHPGSPEHVRCGGRRLAALQKRLGERAGVHHQRIRPRGEIT